MYERARLNYELLDLRAPRYGRSGVEPSDHELQGKWTSEGLFERAFFSTADLDEDGKVSKVTVEAFKFPGQRAEVALVLAGVHGSEPQGVLLARSLIDKLKQAASSGRRPLYTTIVLPDLIGKKRRAKDARYVFARGKAVEPNRNFPAPGEGYAYVVERGKTRKDHAELLDCERKPLNGVKVIPRILTENRILIQIVELEKPRRAASLHAKLLPGMRGDGPGIFVDPRGGFNEHTDAPFTALGATDDALAFSMLSAALDMVKKQLPLTSVSGVPLTHPFWGNLHNGEKRGAVDETKPTVHYTSTKHPAGSSFGMWAPEPERCGNRLGVTTLTIELPRHKRPSATAVAELGRVHTEVLARQFLGL